jgi:hypothetical protein
MCTSRDRNKIRKRRTYQYVFFCFEGMIDNSTCNHVRRLHFRVAINAVGWNC